MNNRVREIYDAFDGKLVGSKRMKIYVCETLVNMPLKIVDFVTKIAGLWVKEIRKQEKEKEADKFAKKYT